MTRGNIGKSSTVDLLSEDDEKNSPN